MAEGARWTDAGAVAVMESVLIVPDSGTDDVDLSVGGGVCKVPV